MRREPGACIFWGIFKLGPRLSVDQGIRDDGTRKVRAVDHFSWANSPGSPKKRKQDSVNGFTVLPEKMRHDHVDDLLEAVKLFLTYVSLSITYLSCAIVLAFERLGMGLPGLWKTDIKDAFRRISLLPAHRWAATIAFMCMGQVT